MESPGKIKKTTHIISVKSADLNDTGRSGTCSLRFKVSKKAYSKKQMRKCTRAAAYQAQFVSPSYKFSKPTSLQFKNYKEFVFAGDSIQIEADFKNAFSNGIPEQKINFQLADSKGNTVYKAEDNGQLNKNGKIVKSFKIPLYTNTGQYKIIAQVEQDEEVVTAERDLTVKEKPFVRLSSNRSLTYADFFSSLGWAVVILMVILLVFFGLLGFEYKFSQYAALRVTESELKKDGYID